jgi:hypothetical protein
MAKTSTGRPRAQMFRALGEQDPPAQVEIAGQPYHCTEILKHDSWAATAIYAGTAGKVVCKFNRQQSILGVPMQWLGCWLAQHEAGILRRLQDLPHVPRWSGDVKVDGKVLPFAVAHEYVEGHPLGRGERVSPDFFPKLEATLREIHRRRMAYVDLHKRENILVGDDGQPYLLDFQISFVPSRRWPGNTVLGQTILELLQKADAYHLQKHVRKERRARGAAVATPGFADLPWYIRLHRFIGMPLRWLRRNFLVTLGIRTGKGRADSEHFAEDAVRQAHGHKKAA